MAQTTTQSFFNTPKLSIVADNTFNNALALKHQSVKITGTPKPNGGDFVTNSSLAFKWVQPEFVSKWIINDYLLNFLISHQFIFHTD